MNPAFLFGVAFLTALSTVADVIYDIDYEPPEYTNGQIMGSTGVISDSIDGFSVRVF
jgi:hypothetical protein